MAPPVGTIVSMTQKKCKQSNIQLLHLEVRSSLHLAANDGSSCNVWWGRQRQQPPMWHGEHQKRTHSSWPSSSQPTSSCHPRYLQQHCWHHWQNMVTTANVIPFTTMHPLFQGELFHRFHSLLDMTRLKMNDPTWMNEEIRLNSRWGRFSESGNF